MSQLTTNHQPPTTNLLLIGFGSMGGSLAVRWDEQLASEFSITIVDPNPRVDVTHAKRIADLPSDYSPGIIVLAVKPQQLDEVMPELARAFPRAAYLSIAAGKMLSYYEKHLGQGAAVVRAMPNTPALIGQGMTVLIANRAADEKIRAQAGRLMAAAGEVMWLEDEGQMDAVTALSGSGPAYLYYIIECLVAAGIKHGLTRQQAEKLVRSTCKGSAMLAQESSLAIEDLRRQVTSPGGTTEAALAVFQKDAALQALIEEAVSAAVTRAKSL